MIRLSDTVISEAVQVRVSLRIILISDDLILNSGDQWLDDLIRIYSGDLNQWSNNQIPWWSQQSKWKFENVITRKLLFLLLWFMHPFSEAVFFCAPLLWSSASVCSFSGEVQLSFGLNNAMTHLYLCNIVTPCGYVGQWCFETAVMIRDIYDLRHL